MKDFPQAIDPAATFEALVQWFHNEMIVAKKAPGFLVGLSGTDSIVAFCAASKALERAGKGSRMMGVHFAPSEDFLYDHPEAEVHLWFQNEVLPWLKEYAPNAEVVVDTSIDWRYDGLRWGYLMDLSVVSNDRRRIIRLPEDQYWVVGTRNRTEDTLLNYSNASTAASIQPIIQLWKSEILQLTEYLGAPQIAVKKSCETDCICGRMQIAGQYVREIDLLLMNTYNTLDPSCLENIPNDVRLALNKFIISQISKNGFKVSLPYTPESLMVNTKDPLVLAFEDGSLKLNEFNHYKHLYIAWYYLKVLSFDEAVDKYCRNLQFLLEANGQIKRFGLEVTRAYFARIEKIMKEFPTKTFEELVEKCPSILVKNSA